MEGFLNLLTNNIFKKTLYKAYLGSDKPSSGSSPAAANRTSTKMTKAAMFGLPIGRDGEIDFGAPITETNYHNIDALFYPGMSSDSEKK